MTVTPAAKPTKIDLHLERSRFLDAFACLEEALTVSSSQPLDECLAREIQQLRIVRNDLVHSQLRFASIAGELHAIALNSHSREKAARMARLVTVADFVWLKGEASRLASKVAA